jgi:hypothetical protein
VLYWPDWPDPAEGITFLMQLADRDRDTGWGKRRPGWHIGTEEYERRRAGGERELSEGLAALRASRHGAAGS